MCTKYMYCTFVTHGCIYVVGARSSGESQHYVCVCVYVCTSVSRIFYITCMYICVYIYMYICIYVYMYICIYVHVYMYMYVYIYTLLEHRAAENYSAMYVCVYMSTCT